MSTYAEIVERVVQGVQRLKPGMSRAAITMQIDAAFPQINNQVSQEYAAVEDNRKVLRKNVALTFAGGVIAVPSNVLLKYLKDATLVLSTGEKAALIEPYDDFLRVRDNRLPWWSFNNSVLNAINSATNGGGAYAGSATLTCIASPDIPALATDPFTGPDDYTPDLIDAMISFLTGKTEEAASTEAV